MGRDCQALLEKGAGQKRGAAARAALLRNGPSIVDTTMWRRCSSSGTSGPPIARATVQRSRPSDANDWNLMIPESPFLTQYFLVILGTEILETLVLDPQSNI